MSDALYATQQALASVLSSSTVVQNLLGNPARLYDHMPASATFPFVVFGAAHCTSYDSQFETGFETVVTLHIWSRYRGSKEVQDVAQAIYDNLHRASLSVAGQVFISCEFQSADVLPDSDGQSFQGIVRYSVLTQSS